MYPVEFDLLEARSLQEVASLLQKYGEDVRILAGGQSLVPMMKLRLARPKYVIDLNRVPGLSYIEKINGSVHFGPLTRHVEIEESATVQTNLLMMQEAASAIGDAQVRNRGTIGGAIVEADPAGDMGPVILALRARIKAVGPQVERELDSKDFFTFAYTTVLRADEVLSEISVPIPSADSSGVYLKLERLAGDFAIVSVAVQMDRDKDGVCREIGIGLGGANDRPVKAISVEEFLLGKMISPAIIESAAEMIREIASPIEDFRGSAEYKKDVLKVIFRRALEKVTRQRNFSR